MNTLVNTQDKSGKLNPLDLKVLFTLLSLSNKSDRAIAKILGISNTSLSKRRRRLEKDGCIKEYTVIPDLHSMGLDVIVFYFSSTSDMLTPAQLKESRELALKHPEVLCLLEEQNLAGTSWFAVTIHKTYDGFVELSKKVQEDVLSLHPQSQILPRYERHTLIFHTEKLFPKPFSFRNLELLFKQENN